jgi:hypothetical protein
MRLVVRWGLAVVVSGGAFAVSWWVCQEQIGLGEGAALGIAAAVLAVVLAVAGWWAARERRGNGAGPDGARWRVVQKARAGRDAYTAGRDQTVINYQREDQ